MLDDNTFLKQFLEAWYNYEMTTIHDSSAWAKAAIKPLPKRTREQNHLSRDVVHRVKARRRANGRKDFPPLHELHRIGQSSFNVQEFEGLDNGVSTFMGFIGGFVYTPGTESECANEFFTYASSWVNGVDDISKIYMPWYWPEVSVSLTDIVATGQRVIYGCDVNKLFTTLTHLITTEGIAEAGARIAGAAPFEMSAMIASFNDDTASTYKKALGLGKVLSTLLNYSMN